MTRLIDTFGRMHDSLRISVTDRCNIRCFYCMPETDVKFQAREQLLSFDEMERFVSIAAGLGVRKLRLTGGEPLLRKNLSTLIRKLAAIEGIEELALTTNGVLLAQQAAELYDAGLRRINVHLDTLDRERFQQITRRDDFGRVMDGIEACRRLGFGPIKINVVAVKNLIEPDIVPMARFGQAGELIGAKLMCFCNLDNVTNSGTYMWTPPTQFASTNDTYDYQLGVAGYEDDPGLAKGSRLFYIVPAGSLSTSSSATPTPT
ncbi:MAG: radical SAM protein, partial [Bryobacteraceae bacterium]